MKTVAIIQARMGSSRLPGKVLAEAAGKPLLQHMIERLGKCETLDDIIVASPGTEENLPLMNLVFRMGIRNYLGSETDVLERVLKAAQAFEADLIVELTADCPLIDPAIVDRTVTMYKNAAKALYIDFVGTSRDCFRSYRDPSLGYPRGMDVRVFSREVLEEVDLLTQDSVDREHVSLYIWEHRNRFHCFDLIAPYELRDEIRLTVDTPEDLELVRTIFEELYPADREFGLGHILKLLKAAPELREINADVKQKEVREERAWGKERAWDPADDFFPPDLGNVS